MSQSLPQRKSPRLKDFDYSQSGAYFVTICAYQRLHLFGQIEDGHMLLNSLGQLTETQFAKLSEFWADVELDSFVIMPNHVHAIIIIHHHADTHNAKPQQRKPTLGQIVGNFKAGVTRLAREQRLIPDETGDGQIWHGRYHDHIIRDEAVFYRIQTYIAENPARWSSDTFFS